MQYKAMEQGISFGFDYEFPLPRSFHTDPTRLKQILINLLGNSLKFTKLGGVKVIVSCNPILETLAFAVTDTGIGMTDEQQKKLFQAFTQGDTSTTRQFGGTGLGLVISHQLATKLGGSIEVESVQGRGSTFTLTIPCGDVKDCLTDTKPLPSTQELFDHTETSRLFGRVLLAEDGPDNQNYISFILKKIGVDFTLVENGARAVDAAQGKNFDLILMDMQMPVMDGYTATKKLRDNGCTTPIVALTANIMKQDVQKCLEAGCTDFLGKPFERRAFIEKLSLFLTVQAPEDDNALFCKVIEEDELPLIIGFVDGLPQRLFDIQQAFNQQNWEMVGMLAHRLRGATMFGYPLLGETATNLECKVKEASYDEIEPIIQMISEVCRKIQNGKSALKESGTMA